MRASGLLRCLAVAAALAAIGLVSPAFAQPAGKDDKPAGKDDKPAGKDDKPKDAPAKLGDEAAMNEVGTALEALTAGKTDDAIAKLTSVLERCGECETTTRAFVLMGLGIAFGDGKSDLERAKQLFVMALREDGSMELDKQFAARAVQQAFAEAQRDVKKTPGGPGKGATRLPPTKEQLAAADAARALLAQGNWSDCMGTILGAGDAEFAAGKLVLAECEDKGGLLLEAAKDGARAAELAKEEGDAALATKAHDLTQKLENDTPRIIVLVPASIDAVVVKIDGIAFDEATAKNGIPKNPGKATVEVIGKKAGYPFNWKTVVEVDRGEKATVDAAEAKGSSSSAVQQCLANAKTAAEVTVCLETEGKGRGLTFKGSFELASYNDSVNVDALTPGLKLSFENPTQGWQLGGSALVDVVSAASPDIVATASRRFDQARFAGTIGGDVKIDVVKVGAGGGLSYESDYVGRSVSAHVSADVLDKRLTPALAYSFGYDTIGISGTPFDEFSHSLFIHAIDASMSAVLSASTLLVGAGTFIYEDGDQSKPYRHIPLFSEDVAATVPRGATPDLVGAARLPEAPLEQLPDARSRGAVSVGIRYRSDDFTIRGDERFYIDSWGLKAST
ncbi:MAG TPA: hypothetical protein VL400_16340, partial [Polyangiaceae bacterium]|nr:hypothetical protein [Polyangiaceae bacterium]